MKIHTEEHYGEWYAFDDHTYDGAEDAHSPVGCGTTDYAAINDLVEQLLGALEDQIERLEDQLRRESGETSPLAASVRAFSSPGAVPTLPGDNRATTGLLEGFPPLRWFYEEPESRFQGRMRDEPEDNL